jgi:hypothetical protein
MILMGFARGRWRARFLAVTARAGEIFHAADALSIDKPSCKKNGVFLQE